MMSSLGQGLQTARFLDTWGNYPMLVNLKAKNTLLLVLTYVTFQMNQKGCR